MKKLKINGFILLESIISLSILSLALFSLSISYSTSTKSQKKFSDSENLAFCLRSATIARKKGIKIPQEIILNNYKYQINVSSNHIRATSPITNKTMDLKWDEK